MARRAGPDAAALVEFDVAVATGADEAEAAFRVLEARGMLWRVDEPGLEAAPVSPSSGDRR